jgi:hypothetical protein
VHNSVAQRVVLAQVGGLDQHGERSRRRDKAYWPRPGRGSREWRMRT